MTERVAERFRWAVETLDPAPSDRLLEIGCGPGVAVSLICETLSTGTITAIDRSKATANALSNDWLPKFAIQLDGLECRSAFVDMLPVSASGTVDHSILKASRSGGGSRPPESTSSKRAGVQPRLATLPY
jgi:hypothetical protein